MVQHWQNLTTTKVCLIRNVHRAIAIACFVVCAFTTTSSLLMLSHILKLQSMDEQNSYISKQLVGC